MIAKTWTVKTWTVKTWAARTWAARTWTARTWTFAPQIIASRPQTGCHPEACSLRVAMPVRSPFATLLMHMIASERPSVLERVRGVLADRDLMVLLGLALAVRLAAIAVFPSL